MYYIAISVYNQKNQNFDNAPLQNSCPERAAIADRQGAREDVHFEGKRTQSKIDASYGKSYFNIATLKKEKGQISIESLETLPLSNDNVKLLYLLSAKEAIVVAGLNGSDVFIRKLYLPLKERRKILATLPFQFESLLPFPPEKAVICPQIKSVSQQMTAVTLFAVAEEALLQHLAELKELEIRTDVLSCEPMALVRFTHWNFPTEKKILSFHLRENKILYALAEEENLILSQTIPLEKLDALEIEKIAVYLKQKGLVDEETPWVLTGESCDPNIFNQVFTGPQLKIQNEQYCAFAIPIGLALDAAAGDELSLQFCNKTLTPEHTQKKRRKMLLSYLAICFLATITALWGNAAVLGKKQKTLVQLLKSEGGISTASPDSLPIEELELALFNWEKQLNQQKNTFPFHSPVPLVSDILAWLSSHPSFTSDDGGKREGIEIKTLHYQLNKYPKIGQPQNPYIATLSLDFSAETPRLARDFHEDLLLGKGIVNNKKEIVWQTQGHSYHTSFDLKKQGSP